jgi:hypothetical protein
MCYERYLARRRGDGPLWYEVWPAIATGLLLVAVIVNGRPWSIGGWIAAGVNGLLLLGIAKMASLVVALRGQFFDDGPTIENAD